MKSALAALLLGAVVCCTACGVIEQLGPFMKRTGETLTELGRKKLDKGDGGLQSSDLMTGLGLILGGSILTGGGAWALKNGRRNGGGHVRPGS